MSWNVAREGAVHSRACRVGYIHLTRSQAEKWNFWKSLLSGVGGIKTRSNPRVGKPPAPVTNCITMFRYCAESVAPRHFYNWLPIFLL